MAEQAKPNSNGSPEKKVVREVKKTFLQQFANMAGFADAAADTSLLALLGWLIFKGGRGLPPTSVTDASRASQAPDLDDEGFFRQILSYIRTVGGGLGAHWAGILTEVHAALEKKDRRYSSDFRKIATAGIPKGEIHGWIQKLFDNIQPRLADDTRREDLLDSRDANIVALADICREVEHERTVGGRQLSLAQASEIVAQRMIDQGWLPKTLAETAAERANRALQEVQGGLNTWGENLKKRPKPPISFGWLFVIIAVFLLLVIVFSAVNNPTPKQGSYADPASKWTNNPH